MNSCTEQKVYAYLMFEHPDGGDISIQTNSGHIIVNHKGTSEKNK